MDQQIPSMNDRIWAESINAPHARVLKARYYGEISYIDHCLGNILQAVEDRGDAENTLICFFSDHGDHLGDHHAWQKESFFEPATHVPYLVSWPARIPQNERRSELVCLADLFGIATGAAGQTETREGIDVLGLLDGSAEPRDALFGHHGCPGTDAFKTMVRDGRWKYIYLANGGQEQLFDLENDPDELSNLTSSQPDIAAELRRKAVSACRRPGTRDALEGDDFKEFPFSEWEWEGERVYQFDRSSGVSGFPENPEDVLEDADVGLDAD